MKAIVKGLVCDTETAEFLYSETSEGVSNSTVSYYRAPEGHKFYVEGEVTYSFGIDNTCEE